jgi:phenylpropionate dioxygenase-like ring-hydroxylating dioxygenase large terminal subunit
MNALEHWHPVALSSSLRRPPVGITLLGRRVTLFRAESGTPGAVDSRCAHMHMDLTHGRVCGERLVCPMHGWSYDAQGGTRNHLDAPHAHRHACYEVGEKYGLIWIRRGGASRPLPILPFEAQGYELASVGEYPMHACLAKTLDHFLEVDHTPMVHVTLGFNLQRGVEIDTTYEDERITTIYRGYQMPIRSLVRFFIHGKEDDVFVDKFTTWFAPIHTTYEHHWLDPVSFKKKADKRVYATFFTPTDDTHTTCFSIAFYHDALMELPVLGPMFRALYRLLITPINKYYMNVEMFRDQRILEKLHDREDHIDDMQLEEDKAELMRQRRRYVDRCYFKGSVDIVGE